MGIRSITITMEYKSWIIYYIITINNNHNNSAKIIKIIIEQRKVKTRGLNY